MISYEVIGTYCLPDSMYWFLFCKGDLLLQGSDAEGWRVPQGEASPIPLEPWQRQHRLPVLDGQACCAVRIDAPVVAAGFRMEGLRTAYDLLPRSVYGMAGKAQEILHWDFNTRFCGVCGAPMKLHTDISKRCTNCGKEVWPQLAAAIIVAVTRGDEILLVQSKNFRSDYMGLVAGFVETGETLEECVAREVMEETGIRVKNIRYYGSQSWPFPAGLMLGFTADYESGTLIIQRSELNKGGWFHYDRMPPIPGKISMARSLIDHWLEQKKNSL